MTKRIIKISLIVLTTLLLITGCQKVDTKKAKDFKESYESLNGKTNAFGQEHRTVTINENNPFVEVSAEEAVKRIEKGETLYLYIGDKMCPWCRSVIEKAVEVANKNKIKEILYIPIWDDNGTEILRDKFIINDDNVLEKIVDGTESYQKMLELFDEVLDAYTVTRGETTVTTGEKRIFAPTFIYVKNKEAKRITTGISDFQVDSREELTEAILKDEEEKLTNFFTGATCDDDKKC